MRIHKPRWPVFSLLIFLFSGCGGGSSDTPTKFPTPGLLHACPALPASTAPEGSLSATIDALVANEMEAAGLPGMEISLSKGGRILYSHSYGYADLSACQPAKTNTAYQMGSVTKQFTAAAILQLQDAGKLKLDDPVNAYLPGYAFDPNLSLRMLLNQTSGLPDYVEFAAAPAWTGGAAQASILAAISHTPSLFVAGSAYAYSNSNYFILGAIIEHVSGRSYADYLAQHILLPLGLANTSYLDPTATAMPYTYTRPLLPGAQGLAPGIVLDSSYLFAAGALWTTAEDLNKWDAALLNGEVIPAALFAMAVMPPATVTVFQQAPTASPYAMGWIRNSLAGHPFVWHNGKTYAYTAFNGMFLDDGFSVSVLTNVDIQEDTPLLTFSTKLIQAVCAASPASC